MPSAKSIYSARYISSIFIVTFHPIEILINLLQATSTTPENPTALDYRCFANLPKTLQTEVKDFEHST